VFDTVTDIVKVLPKSFEADFTRYSNWLEANFEDFRDKLPKNKRKNLDKRTFVTLAVYKELIGLPVRQLKIINKTFDYLSKYDINTIGLRKGELSKNGKEMEALNILINDLFEVFNSSGAGFILKSFSLNELAKKIVEEGYKID
jgi:hypothetical protein